MICWARATCCALAVVAAGAAAAQDLVLRRADLAPFEPAGILVSTAPMPVADPALPPLAAQSTDPALGLLRRQIAQGRSAGLAGVLYDNRDRGHSTIGRAGFPALVHVVYDAALRSGGLDYGLAGGIRFGVPVIGNSSTAVTGGPSPRSLPRLAMTSAEGPSRAFGTYAANAIYVYPEHRDHDAADLFPANWPYMVIAQGSSGSDRPFLEALLMALAALPPETRSRAEAEGLIAPTLQMVMRRSLRQVTSREAYFTGAAHPAVFRAEDLVPGRMVTLAASLAAEALPPMVRIEVTHEDFAEVAGQSERLFDTPAAIARIWRGDAWTRSMTVSAVRTFDPNGRPLTFTWRVLRGDPRSIRIEPFGPDSAQARIRLRWHDPGVTAPIGSPPGGRIDIGVFASNGATDSAPAILSILLPLHEGRVHAPGADGAMQPVRREPDPALPRDPILFPG